jgi:hypothetical protein
MKVIDAESYERGPRTSRGFVGRLIDDFLLRDAEALARRLPETDRQVLLRHVARTRQKLESARLLWAHEQYVEGLRLAEESVVEVLRAAEAGSGVLGPARPDLGLGGTGSPIWADVLMALGATGEDVQDATVAMGGPLGQRPAWNGDVRPEHRRFFRSATRVSEGALERLTPLVTKPGRIVTARYIRLASVVAIAAAFGLTLLSLRGVVDVHASGSFDEIMHEPHKIIDGNPATEWLLPSNTGGWIEVTFRPRTVKAVKLLNAHNPPFGDRGTQDFRIEGYRNNQIVHTSKHKFPKLEDSPHWMTIAIPSLRLDTVRVVIESYHKVGGGLAEIAIE